jgi:hypothetical protein
MAISGQAGIRNDHIARKVAGIARIRACCKQNPPSGFSPAEPSI